MDARPFRSRCRRGEERSGWARPALPRPRRDAAQPRCGGGCCRVSRGQRAGGSAPFTLHGEHIICELDPDDPDDTGFAAALRVARVLALVAVRDRSAVVDAAAVRRDLDGIRSQLDAIAGMKSKLTSISTATGDVRNGLDALRQGVMDRVLAIEGNVAEVAAAHVAVA